MLLAILIFQDIIVVPMILITPLLGGETRIIGMSIASLVLKFSISFNFYFYKHPLYCTKTDAFNC